MRQQRSYGPVRQLLVGERTLHNETVTFRNAYERTLRPHDLLFVEHMARLTPKIWGVKYWAMRLDSTKLPDQRPVLSVMDEAALNGFEQGLGIVDLQSKHIGTVALTNYNHSALWITRDGVVSADMGQGARLGDTVIEIAMDRNDAVLVCDVSPHGTTIHADWSLAYDEDAMPLRATGS